MAGNLSHSQQQEQVWHRRHFTLNVPRTPLPVPMHLYGTPSTPASALADRIFNDPESWNADTRTLIDQFPAVPSGPESAATSTGFATPTLKPFNSRFRLSVRPDVLSPESGSGSGSGSEAESDASGETLVNVNWEGVKVKEDEKAEAEGAGADEGPGPSITISIDRSAKDRIPSLDRMSILWTQGNLFRAFPSPLTSASSAPTSPASADGLGLGFGLGRGLFHSPAATPRSALVKPQHFSPLRPNANSATWSILEYYGVSPETPALRTATATGSIGDSTTTTTCKAPASAGTFLRLPSHPSVPPPPPPPLVVPAKAKPDASQTHNAGSGAAPAPAPPVGLDATPVPIAPLRLPTRVPAPPLQQDASHTQPPPVPQPTARGRSRAGTVRPLPSIPHDAPPVPCLDPPALWSRPRTRARANTTATIRSLPPTPPPKDRRPLTIPQPAPTPSATRTTRHQHVALSGS
ncbi:hypothetical protein B0H11DRAFT_321516 [Mycena galericulata]|nr:hypothetical protein B0H11DRAFT_321516 [Mycena galericulata]